MGLLKGIPEADKVPPVAGVPPVLEGLLDMGGNAPAGAGVGGNLEYHLVETWGSTGAFYLPKEVSIVQAAAGWAHYVCLEVGGEVYTWGWKECVPSRKVIGDPNSAQSLDNNLYEGQNPVLTEQGITVSLRSHGSRATGVDGKAIRGESTKRKRMSSTKQVVENSSLADEPLLAFPCLVALNSGVRIATVTAGRFHTGPVYILFHWDLLFQPLFDELLNPPPSVDNQDAEVIAPIAEVIPQVDDDSTGSPSLTEVDQDAPSPSKSLTPTETQSPVILQDDGNDKLDIEVAHMGNDPIMATTIEQQTALDESLVPTQLHHHSIRFKIDTRKSVLDLEAFREMLHISPRIPNQQFADLPTEEEVLDFLRFLGHSQDIRYLTDVNVNKLYQPWRSFASVINKCLTGKSSGVDSFRLNSKAYQEYYACAMGEAVPKPKASARKKKELSWKSSDDEEVGSHEEGKESNDDSNDESDKDSEETVKSGAGKDGDDDDDEDD
nr:hypothetical protein [Tanacetum cinerariifolium]